MTVLTLNAITFKPLYMYIGNSNNKNFYYCIEYVPYQNHGKFHLDLTILQMKWQGILTKLSLNRLQPQMESTFLAMWD